MPRKQDRYNALSQILEIEHEEDIESSINVVIEAELSQKSAFDKEGITSWIASNKEEVSLLLEVGIVWGLLLVKTETGGEDGCRSKSLAVTVAAATALGSEEEKEIARMTFLTVGVKKNASSSGNAGTPLKRRQMTSSVISSPSAAMKNRYLLTIMKLPARPACSRNFDGDARLEWVTVRQWSCSFLTLIVRCATFHR